MKEPDYEALLEAIDLFNSPTGYIDIDLGEHPKGSGEFNWTDAFSKLDESTMTELKKKTVSATEPFQPLFLKVSFSFARTNKGVSSQAKGGLVLQIQRTAGKGSTTFFRGPCRILKQEKVCPGYVVNLSVPKTWNSTKNELHEYLRLCEEPSHVRFDANEARAKRQFGYLQQLIKAVVGSAGSFITTLARIAKSPPKGTGLITVVMPGGKKTTPTPGGTGPVTPEPEPPGPPAPLKDKYPGNGAGRPSGTVVLIPRAGTDAGTVALVQFSYKGIGTSKAAATMFGLDGSKALDAPHESNITITGGTWEKVPGRPNALRVTIEDPKTFELSVSNFDEQYAYDADVKKEVAP